MHILLICDLFSPALQFLSTAALTLESNSLLDLEFKDRTVVNFYPSLVLPFEAECLGSVASEKRKCPRCPTVCQTPLSPHAIDRESKDIGLRPSPARLSRPSTCVIQFRVVRSLWRYTFSSLADAAVGHESGSSLALQCGRADVRAVAGKIWLTALTSRYVIKKENHRNFFPRGITQV